MSKDKTIYVFHFKDLNQPKFDANDTDYCMILGQTYPYTIKYYPVDLYMSIEEIYGLISLTHSVSQMDQTTSQVLFLLDLIEPEIEQKIEPIVKPEQGMFHWFKQIIGLAPPSEVKPEVKPEVKDKPSRLHLFLDLVKYIREYVQNFTLYVLKDEFLKQYTGIDLYTRKGMPFKKVLTVLISDKHRTGFVRGIENRNYTRFFKKADTRKLICLEWFMYFSNTAFGCISGRLIQVSGTCYLNTIVNGIILSPVMRNFVLDRMKTMIDLDLRPLDASVCDIKDNTYLYRLLYNMVCSRVSLKDFVYRQDIMVEFSKLYSENVLEPGQGGRPIPVLKKFLELIDGGNIPETLDYKDDGTLGWDKLSRHNPNFLVIDFVKWGKTIDKKISYLDSVFHLQFAAINFETKGGGAHVVLGMICDGQYIVFDSNGHSINLDWTRIRSDEGIRNTFFTFFSSYKFERRIVEITPMYANQSVVDKYSDIQLDTVCNTIDSNQITVDKHILERATNLPRKQFLYLRELLRIKGDIPIDNFPEEYRAILSGVTDDNLLNYAKVFILTDEPTPEILTEMLKNYTVVNTTIYFFHITGSTEDSFKLHGNYCKSDDTYYPYNIRYYTVSNTISNVGLDNLKNVVRTISSMDPAHVKTIFYTNGSGDNNKAMVKILNYISMHTRNAIALINHKDNTDTTAYVSFHEDNTIKRLINIVYTDKVYTEADGNWYDIMSFSSSGNNDNDLVCNTWFRYFAS